MPFAILLLVLRQWWLGILYVAATAWSMIGVAWIYLPVEQPPAGPQSLKVMSFNVYFGNHDPGSALERIAEHDPDVVTIVEYANHIPDELSALEQKYPYQILEPRWHGFGIAMFSKRPLETTKIQQLPVGKNIGRADCPMIDTMIRLDNGQAVRLVGIHLLSPVNEPRMEIRNRQLIRAAEILQDNHYPMVVMGDFNCTPWSSYLDNFLQKTGLRDSRQGFGYQATWHRSLGLLKIPIDHFFVSPEIHVHRRYVAEPGGSDHLPIVIEVSVGKE